MVHLRSIWSRDSQWYRYAVDLGWQSLKLRRMVNVHVTKLELVHSHWAWRLRGITTLTPPSLMSDFPMNCSVVKIVQPAGLEWEMQPHSTKIIDCRIETNCYCCGCCQSTSSSVKTRLPRIYQQTAAQSLWTSKLQRFSPPNDCCGNCWEMYCDKSKHKSPRKRRIFSIRLFGGFILGKRLQFSW